MCPSALQIEHTRLLLALSGAPPSRLSSSPSMRSFSMMSSLMRCSFGSTSSLLRLVELVSEIDLQFCDYADEGVDDSVKLYGGHSLAPMVR